MKLKKMADDELHDGCLIPVIWMKSAVVLPDGEPFEHDEEASFLSPVEQIDSLGRPLKGLFIPKGTRAVVQWPKERIHTVLDAQHMFFHNQGQVSRMSARGAGSGINFVEIDEGATSLNREGLTTWLAAQYDSKPAAPGMDGGVECLKKPWTHDSDKKWRG
ncbi:MAG: hypothetical protein Q8K86_09080 [Candidatus Nanopelagicaceae bacterium]|nr:hypothetical protein [Candidatus Nanopelagicaceae bacterium]